MKRCIQLITGIIIGGILFSVFPTFANTLKQYTVYESQFPLYVNGKEFKPELPILNYNGSTYIPLRAVADILGVPVDFDGKIIKIGKTEYIPTVKLGQTYKINDVEITLDQIIYDQTDPHISYLFKDKIFMIKGRVKNNSNKLQKIEGVAFLKTNIQDPKQKAIFEDRLYLLQYVNNSDNSFYFNPYEEKEFIIMDTQGILEKNNARITDVLIEISGEKIDYII